MDPPSMKVEHAISNSIKDMELSEATIFINDILRSRNVLCNNRFIALMAFGEYEILSARLLEELGFEQRNGVSILNFLEKHGMIEVCGHHLSRSKYRKRDYKTKLYRIVS